MSIGLIVRIVFGCLGLYFGIKYGKMWLRDWKKGDTVWSKNIWKNKKH